MSEQKRKRMEDHCAPRYRPPNQVQSHNQTVITSSPLLQQPLVVNSVLAQGEQLCEPDQVQVLGSALPADGQNAQSNLVYILLPQNVNQHQNLLQGIQTVLLVPKSEQASPAEGTPQLQYCLPFNDVPVESESKPQENDTVVYIKEKLPKDEPQLGGEYLQTLPTDPLQVQTVQDGNISYTLVSQYGEVQSQPRDVYLNKDVQKVQPPNNIEPVKYKAQFKCDYPGCLLSFPSVYEKKIHAETHIFLASTEFKCTICNMKFERAIDRNKHVDTHSVVNTYKCKTCDKTFPYYTSLVKHVNEKCANTKSCSCHYCGVQFVDVDDLIKHQKDNMKRCVCQARVCSEQAFDFHTTLCSLYKQKMGSSKRRKSKHAGSDVLD